MDVQTPQALFDCWNSTVQVLPKVRFLTRERIAHANQRLEQYPDTDWEAVIRRMEASAFLRGESGNRGWRASFDFLLRPATPAKVLEGIYDDRPPSPVSAGNAAAAHAWLTARRGKGRHDVRR